MREAAEIMRQPFQVKRKGDITNLCTSADIAVQKFLYGRLLEIVPGSGFLGEEEGLVDLDHERVWVVDPIDGTANFSRGIPECTISVALRERGEIVLGVVYNPFHDELYSAVKGEGATLNGTPLHVSERPFEDGILLTAMSLYDKRYAPACNAVIMEAYGRCNDVRRFGACAIELCYLARGLCDLFFEYRLQAWDYAAAWLVVKEAGGVLSARGGEALTFDRPTLLVAANNAENHRILDDIVCRHTSVPLYDEK